MRITTEYLLFIESMTISAYFGALRLKVKRIKMLLFILYTYRMYLIVFIFFVLMVGKIRVVEPSNSADSF